MTATFDKTSLEPIIKRLRINIVKMVALAGSGHNGGSLSAIDIIAYLYFCKMRLDPKRPDWQERDRFVLSKGHCAPALYVTLAARGYFPEDVLWTLRDIESKLQGHPDMRKTTGVDMTTGSLGQGFSAACGMAKGLQLQNIPAKVYCMVGDGELQEGQVWEAAMSASHYKLDNLVVIVDNNKLETDGATANIMNVEPIDKKFAAFGFNVRRINGHNLDEIHYTFERLEQNGKPNAVIAETIKGKGVSFMENNHAWHAGPTSPEQTEQALKELEAA